MVALLLQELFFGTLERGVSPRRINTIKNHGLCFGVKALVLMRHTVGHDAARWQSMKDTVRDIANPPSKNWAGNGKNIVFVWDAVESHHDTHTRFHITQTREHRG